MARKNNGGGGGGAAGGGALRISWRHCHQRWVMMGAAAMRWRWRRRLAVAWDDAAMRVVLWRWLAVALLRRAASASRGVRRGHNGGCGRAAATPTTCVWRRHTYTHTHTRPGLRPHDAKGIARSLAPAASPVLVFDAIPARVEAAGTTPIIGLALTAKGAAPLGKAPMSTTALLACRP